MSEEESFKVTDRRGRGTEAPGEAPRQREASAPDPPPRERDRARTSSTGPGPIELSTLFMMFADSALVNLGAVPEPGSDQPRLDLEQARSAIDILLMLRDKTHGNRTEQEARLLEELVYDLQMRFVRATRGGPS
jgi:Domain of unknown function (DUF1844)